VVWNRGSARRRFEHPESGRVDLVEELDTETVAPTLVPPKRLQILDLGFGFEVNAEVHFLRRGDSARERTSFHEVPGGPPASTRRARCSISAAQAASTSAGSSLLSSRLARSCAATSARSSSGKARASRRSSRAREVMALV